MTGTQEVFVLLNRLFEEALYETEAFSEEEVNLAHTAQYVASVWYKRLATYRAEVAAFPPTVLDLRACTPFAITVPYEESTWGAFWGTIGLGDDKIDQIFLAFARRLRQYVEEHAELILPSGHPIRLEEGNLALF